MGARQFFCLWVDCLSIALLARLSWLALGEEDGDCFAQNIDKGEGKDANDDSSDPKCWQM